MFPDQEPCIRDFKKKPGRGFSFDQPWSKETLDCCLLFTMFPHQEPWVRNPLEEPGTAYCIWSDNRSFSNLVLQPHSPISNCIKYSIWTWKSRFCEIWTFESRTVLGLFFLCDGPGISPPRGLRDSLLEPAQKIVKNCCQWFTSFAKCVWQRRQSLSVFI